MEQKTYEEQADNFSEKNCGSPASEFCKPIIERSISPKIFSVLRAAAEQHADNSTDRGRRPESSAVVLPVNDSSSSAMDTASLTTVVESPDTAIADCITERLAVVGQLVNSGAAAGCKPLSTHHGDMYASESEDAPAAAVQEDGATSDDEQHGDENLRSRRKTPKHELSTEPTGAMRCSPVTFPAPSPVSEVSSGASAMAAAVAPQEQIISMIEAAETVLMLADHLITTPPKPGPRPGGSARRPVTRGGCSAALSGRVSVAVRSLLTDPARRGGAGGLPEGRDKGSADIEEAAAAALLLASERSRVAPAPAAERKELPVIPDVRVGRAGGGGGGGDAKGQARDEEEGLDGGRPRRSGGTGRRGDSFKGVRAVGAGAGGTASQLKARGGNRAAEEVVRRLPIGAVVEVLFQDGVWWPGCVLQVRCWAAAGLDVCARAWTGSDLQSPRPRSSRRRAGWRPLCIGRAAIEAGADAAARAATLPPVGCGCVARAGWGGCGWGALASCEQRVCGRALS
jgi:hypothetical protein